MSDNIDILEKLGLENINVDNYNILVACLREIFRFYEGKSLRDIQDWGAPLLNHLKRLNNSEIIQLERDILINKTTIEECQVLVQKKIAKKERKKLAAYYTTDEGTDLMALVVSEYIEEFDKKNIIIADPFLGAGRTLTTTIKKIGIKKIKEIWGIEPYPLSALVAYAALLKTTGGNKKLIKIIVGDSFDELSKQNLLVNKEDKLTADIILTNPPFTRWKYLNNGYRNKLLKIIKGLGYSKYITRKETSLQILSMFLCDILLENNGLLISVLPASTFYTIYGRGYKDLIRKKYHLLSFLESKSQTSFSIDSGFKEIIIIGIKGLVAEGLTAFGELNGINTKDFAKYIINYDIETLKKLEGLYLVNLNEIAQFLDNNWLSLVGNNELKESLIKIFKSGIKNGILGYWSDILGEDTIIRGIEMYGPEFFFIRNKYWDIIEDVNNHIKIKNKETSKELLIEKKFLVRTLRKPSLYNYTINPKVDTYMLSIPSNDSSKIPNDLKQYVQWGKESESAKPAVRKFKKYWYSHIYDQIKSKNPFGEIFITDKVDLMFVNRGIFANYSETKLAASKNFYIVKNLEDRYYHLLAAWFNSTIFISILIQFSRKISDTWTRFLINDYLEVPILDITKIGNETYEEIYNNLKIIMNKELPPFWDQLEKDYRYNLDISIAKALKVENPEDLVKKLYNNIRNYYNRLK